jgi:hypothetical protein
MRSQVQVLAGPPPIPPGHGAAGREPGTPAASWGRTPIPAGPAHWPRRARPPGRQAPDDHAPWSPTPAPTAATRPLRQPRAAACTRAHSAAASHGAAHAGLACLVAQRSSAAAGRQHTTRPASAPDPTDQRATPAASPASRACSAVHRATPRGGSPPGLDPLLWCRLPAAPAWSPPPPPEVGRDGRVRTDGQTAVGWTPDGWTPDGRTPDRLDTGRPGHRTAGRRARTTNPEWAHTTWWTPTGDRRHRRHPGLADHGDDAQPLDAGWTLRRADAVWAVYDQDRSAARTTRGYHAAADGPGRHRDDQLQVVRRRPAGALAHCCPRRMSGRA